MITDQVGREHIPKYLMTDMEPAVAASLLKITPQVIILYCFFHWRKALRDQLSKKRALVFFNQSDKFQRFYRLITTLAFIPPEDVIDTWENTLDGVHKDLEEELTDEAVN